MLNVGFGDLVSLDIGHNMLAKNDFTHALMFHHFHDEKHPVSQGSLSGDQFERILDWTAENFNLINAQDYLDKLQAQSLLPSDVCITFDDSLLCQAEIAAPILRNRNLQAFFFIVSSPFLGDPNYLEIHRYFRTTCFPNIDDFYRSFFDRTRSWFPALFAQAKKVFDPDQYLSAYGFYSKNDKWFRYLRDIGLGESVYIEAMNKLMAENSFDQEEIREKLWMNEANIQDLNSQGHMIGLHSFSHPLKIHLMDSEKQMLEYSKNREHLMSLTGKKVVSMAHPLGNYNDETLKILRSLDIQIGFRDNCSIKKILSNLEVPREDASNILSQMPT